MLLRASSVERRSLCPGSAKAEEGLPNEDSEWSEEGTLLHALDADPSKDRSKLTRTQRDLLNTSARLTKEIFERIGDQFGTAGATPDAAGFEREMFLHRGIRCLYSGHCDVWEYFESRKLLVVIEKKFGYLPVEEAERNMQARTYACMGAEAHDCNNVVVAISQPRMSRDDQTIACYGRADILAARQQLFAIWDACHAEDAPLVAGDDQCRYCLYKTAPCPAFEANIGQGLSLVPPLPNNGKLTARARDAFIETAISKASNEDLVRMHGAVTLAGFAKDPLFDEMRRRIKAEELPGYRLKNTGELSDVTDVAKARVLLNLNLGLPLDKINAALSMSLKDIQDAYRDLNPGMTEMAAKQAVRDLLGDLITRTPKKPSVEKAKGGLIL